MKQKHNSTSLFTDQSLSPLVTNSQSAALGECHHAELVIMASHQTFSGQVKHLSDQTEFGQTNLLYIINGEIVEFTKEKQMSGQFSALIISTALTI